MISIESQALTGLLLAGLGWTLGRWAARHDVKSWFTDAIWRAVWSIFRRGEWRKGLDLRAEDVIKSDTVLSKQLSEKFTEVKSDAQRLGTTGAAIKHGGKHALAYAVGLMAGPILVVGLTVLAHAAWRWSH